jgi:NAD-dependent dihydropyrimidine dehydrogenase PreA subunit
MIVVNEERCLGCGICTHFCPVDALEGWGVICINRERCTDCLSCVGTCPVDALEVKE